MIFDFLKEIFNPVRDVIDDLHTSDEEAGEIKIKLKTLDLEFEKIQTKFYNKAIELQSQVIDANSKVAIAEQQSGSVISKNWRPLCSIASFVMLSLMGIGIIPMNEFLATIYGSMIGYHGVLRSLVDKKK